MPVQFILHLCYSLVWRFSGRPLSSEVSLSPPHTGL